MPSKRSRRDRKSVNESSAKRGTRRNHSSSDEHDDKKNFRPSKSISNKSKSYVQSSSEDDSNFKNKTRNKLRKKNPRESTSESSDNDRKSKLHRSAKKNIASDDDRGKRSKKNRSTKKQEDSSSDDSIAERPIRIKKKLSETEAKRKVASSEIEDSSCENNKKSNKKLSLNKEKSTSSDCEQGKVKNREIKIDEKVKETKLGSKSSGTLSAEDVISKKKIKLAILWLNNTVKDIAELGTLVSVRAKKFGEKKVNLENLKTYEDVLTTVTKLKQLISGVHSNYEHIEKNLDAQLKPWKVLTGKDKECATLTQEGEMTTVRSQTNKNILPVSNDTLPCANNSHDKVPVPEKESAKEYKTKPQELLNGSGDDSDNNEKKNTKDLEFKADDTLSCANNSHEKVPVPEKESTKEDKTAPQDNDGEFEHNWSGDDSDNNEKKNTKDLITKLNESLDKMDELETTEECKNKKDKLESTDKESSGLESQNLKNGDKNKSSNASSFEKFTGDNDKSSKVLANDSDEEKSLEIFPNDAEKVNFLFIFVVYSLYQLWKRTN